MKLSAPPSHVWYYNFIQFLSISVFSHWFYFRHGHWYKIKEKKKKAPQTIIWFKQLWKSESNFGLYIKNFKTRCENTKLITNREKINKHTEVHK